MENNEVLQPGQSGPEFSPDPARPETVQPVPPYDSELAVIDFTEDELHMVIGSLINMARDMKEEFPYHRAITARADKYFDLAERLDEEYSEYFLTED